MSALFATYGLNFFFNISNMNEKTAITTRFVNNAETVRQKIIYGLNRDNGLLNARWGYEDTEDNNNEYRYIVTLKVENNTDENKDNFVDVVYSFDKKLNQLKVQYGTDTPQLLSNKDIKVEEFNMDLDDSLTDYRLLKVNILYKITNSGEDYYFEQAIRQALPKE